MTVPISPVAVPATGTGQDLTGRPLTSGLVLIMSGPAPAPGHGCQPVPPRGPGTVPACGCATPPPGWSSWPRPPPR